MTDQCSFCEASATTNVNSEHDIMPSCQPCADAWAEDPGFLREEEQGERVMVDRALNVFWQAIKDPNDPATWETTPECDKAVLYKGMRAALVAAIPLYSGIQRLLEREERMREAAARVLSWWPENSENGKAGRSYGSGFADDIRNLRTTLSGEGA